jgi:hypothetical protein
MMAAAGILGEYKGSQAREVTMTLEEYEKIREQMVTDAEDKQQKTQETLDEPAYVSHSSKMTPEPTEDDDDQE